MEASVTKKETEKHKPENISTKLNEKKIEYVTKKIANEVIKEFERILEWTDEFQDLDDKERKQVESSVLEIVKRHGW